MIYIDNTGVLRVKAKLTAIDGTVVLLSETGTYTIYDSAGDEVPGQVWPANLTLNEPGDYAGAIESDVEFLAGRKYTAVITIGTEPDTRAVFNVELRPSVRGRD
jgi:hypothetical protein